ncbi:hypothetical protein A2U01_0082493, partial [Trifolium medium]|nr:hypothetical protein [Trifolium medium]
MNSNIYTSARAPCASHAARCTKALKPTTSSRIEPAPYAVQPTRRAKDKNQPVSCITSIFQGKS